MSVLFLFSVAIINRAAQPGDGSTPYKNAYHVACTGYKPDCVQDKCVSFGRGVTLCTECTSGKVPINGGCVGKDDTDLSIDISICNQEDSGNGGKRCASCTGEPTSRSDAYFLFYGGCYNKNEWPGSHICKTVSNGMCSVCETDYENIFMNPDADAEEKCILCGDTVGFNGKAGIDGCSTCVSLSKDPTPNNAASTASIQCTSCLDDSKAPIDGVCTDIGSNKCENGYCTHCAVGYVYHKGGCHSKEQEGNNICAEENQIEIAGYSACKQCASASEAPHNGNCGPTTAKGSCNKDTSSGKCTACNKNSPGLTVFFMKGVVTILATSLAAVFAQKLSTVNALPVMKRKDIIRRILDAVDVMLPFPTVLCAFPVPILLILLSVLVVKMGNTQPWAGLLVLTRAPQIIQVAAMRMAFVVAIVAQALI
ncbi:Hypothetical protein GLP15_4869 [Giardia lamblia P15]|uniref:Variant-specific surface protein n=1 Tax=Giardia intestinalis (strain P15) TaxID=658858 RepID=E1F9R3_GIAIA|nr:Hypothetical protein GLP15_4869 [Giardia lamblia P15]